MFCTIRTCRILAFTALVPIIGACGDDDPVGPDTSVAIVVDGVRSAAEWDGATVLPTQSPDVTFYYTNDEETLYLALEIRNEPLSGDDSFSVRFDNTLDGVLTEGDNVLFLTGDGTFRDRHYNGVTISARDSQDNGVGAVAAAGGGSFFEMSQPLSTGDPDDFSLAPGGSVGYCLIFTLNGTGGDGTTLPRRCQIGSSGQADYGVMQIR